MHTSKQSHRAYTALLGRPDPQTPQNGACGPLWPLGTPRSLMSQSWKSYFRRHVDLCDAPQPTPPPTSLIYTPKQFHRAYAPRLRRPGLKTPQNGAIMAFSTPPFPDFPYLKIIFLAAITTRRPPRSLQHPLTNLFTHPNSSIGITPHSWAAQTPKHPQMAQMAQMSLIRDIWP
jgi:hypothetical protein